MKCAHPNCGKEKSDHHEDEFYCFSASDVPKGCVFQDFLKKAGETTGENSVIIDFVLPTDPTARKNVPLARGLLDYFPNALAAVAEVSHVANGQHNPGEEMHWARGKSADHADCILRHLVDRGSLDADGLRHTAKAAWRALAELEEEMERDGAKPGRASKFPVNA